MFSFSIRLGLLEKSSSFSINRRCQGMLKFWNKLYNRCCGIQSEMLWKQVEIQLQNIEYDILEDNASFIATIKCVGKSARTSLRKGEFFL